MKKCEYCAEEVQDDAKKCKHCGEWLNKNTQKEFSNIIPIKKFVLLSFSTFGIYQLFWFYKTWIFFKEKENLKLSPLVRSLLAPIFIFSLAEKIKKHVIKNDIFCDYSSVLIGIIYLCFGFLFYLPGQYWLLGYFSFIILLPLVNMMNKYWKKEEKEDLPLKKFTWWQILLIIFLLLVWFLNLI